MTEVRRWRHVADDGVSASFGLAADEYMASRRAGTPVLRLYTYRAHCALVGRFQQVEAELDLEFCREAGIEVNRRPTGGGAILMGPDQLGVAITIPAPERREAAGGVRELFIRYAAGIEEALGRLGVEASFHRKNDIEVAGRKIAGLGLYFDRSGGLLFHASLLVDLDVPFMLRILRTPFEKISDKRIATVAERVTTVRRETRSEIELAEVRSLLRDSFCETLGLELEESTFDDGELTGIRELEARRYATPGWIEEKSFAPHTFGNSRLKTDGGLVQVHLTLSGDFIQAAYITGDFFADEGLVSTIERSLKRIAVTEADIGRAVDRLYIEEGRELPGVPASDLARAVHLAASAAQGKTESARPGGCFA